MHLNAPQPEPGEAAVRPQLVVILLASSLITVLLVAFLAARYRSSETNVAQPEAVASEAVVETPAAVTELAPPKVIKQDALRNKWGIVVASVNLSAGGTALDIRYKVIDDEKASGMHKLQGETYLLDQRTGRNISTRAQVQPLVTQEMSEGKTYFMMFPNKGRAVRSGDTITLVIGGTRAENLVVN